MKMGLKPRSSTATYFQARGIPTMKFFCVQNLLMKPHSSAVIGIFTFPRRITCIVGAIHFSRDNNLKRDAVMISYGLSCSWVMELSFLSYYQEAMESSIFWNTARYTFLADLFFLFGFYQSAIWPARPGTGPFLG